MTSKPKYPLAILFLAALGGCETEESMGPPLDEEPVEMERHYSARAHAGRIYTPSSWEIGRECMETSDLEDFLANYDWNEMDATNRDRLEWFVYINKAQPEPSEMQLRVCVQGEDWEPTPLESK